MSQRREAGSLEDGGQGEARREDVQLETRWRKVWGRTGNELTPISIHVGKVH